MPEQPLQQVCVSLPPNLITRLQQGAVQSDRTLGGMIRHLVAEWARATPSPEGPRAWGEPVPSVAATPEGIREGKARLADLEQERQRIKERQRRWSDTAADGARLDRLNLEIGITEQRIRLAEQMMRPSNGKGPNDV
jgi:hypothetical protein